MHAGGRARTWLRVLMLPPPTCCLAARLLAATTRVDVSLVTKHHSLAYVTALLAYLDPAGRVVPRGAVDLVAHEAHCKGFRSATFLEAGKPLEGVLHGEHGRLLHGCCSCVLLHAADVR